MSLDCPVGSDLFGCLNTTHLLNLTRLAIFHHGLCHDELLQDLLLGVLTPPEPGFPEVAVLEAEEKLFGSLDGSVVEELFSCSRANPLEHLFAQGLPSDGSNRIHCVLFSADIVDPLKENVLFLGHIDVSGLTALEGCESRLEVLLDLIAVLSCSVQGLLECLYFISLLAACLITHMDQIATLGHFIIVLGIELALDGIVVLLGPGAEGTLQPVFLPVDQYFLHSSLLLVSLSRVL